MAVESLCSVTECSKPACRRGYCSGHYQRLRKYGSVSGGPEKKPIVLCSAVGCDRPKRRNGFCEKHHYRFMRYGDPHREPWKNHPVEWVHQNVTTSSRACLIWPFLVDKVTGYGRLSLKQIGGGSRLANAHKYMCEIAKGPQPSLQHQAAHSCGNRACVNPRHLSWKTQKENEADKLIHGTAPRGERSASAKLTAAEVIAIRNAQGIKQQELADQYGVSRGHIAGLRRGRFWPDLQSQQP